MFPRFHFSIERWRKNEEFGVWVSTNGRVRLIKNKKYLEPRISEKGYCFIFTEKGNICVHRLVAYTWLGDKRNEKYTIDHIDSNKRNNKVSNLRWVPEEINKAYAIFTSGTTNDLQETVQTASIEQSEAIFNKIYDIQISIAKRATAFRKYFLNKKIKILCDGKELTSFQDLYKIKAECAKDANNDDFINRILLSIKNNKTYCSHNWQIQAIENINN